jgi:bifunctional N-acetylglucosamine-1-phosphate-uridyltransferase/glucosamine-1-phosphate-acetyltransferase GlmU-like protein
MIKLKDYQGRVVRLTQERLYHILEHPEMQDQEARISETLLMPDSVILSHNGAQVKLYHKLYTQTPVTQKYLMVVVKILQDDAFVITAFFTDKEKKGVVLWPQ